MSAATALSEARLVSVRSACNHRPSPRRTRLVPAASGARITVTPRIQPRPDRRPDLGKHLIRSPVALHDDRVRAAPVEAPYLVDPRADEGRMLLAALPLDRKVRVHPHDEKDVRIQHLPVVAILCMNEPTNDGATHAGNRKACRHRPVHERDLRQRESVADDDGAGACPPPDPYIGEVAVT